MYIATNNDLEERKMKVKKIDGWEDYMRLIKRGSKK